jgi:hypothetical protein
MVLMLLAMFFCFAGMAASTNLLAETTATPPAAAKSSTQETRITPEQARQLFESVDSILHFDSQNTGLPILHPVKRRLITRAEIESYLTRQSHDDRTAKRLERSALVLKKFGLLDQDFQLGPFLVKLLGEQIAGYYDDKTGTVNLLDWIPPDEQKPVLAHELTHALQDQHIHLRKWSQVSNLSIAKNVHQDNQHLATDEADTAREAVVEGQAMAVFVNYILAPSGKNLLTAPGVVEKMDQAMGDNADSPVMATAPLLLQKSLLFPYTDGLKFVRAVLAARGTQAAFAGLLDRPPSSSYEIMTPQVYLDREPVPLLQMPDIHPLIRKEYQPYDIGVMGEFDIEILSELFGGEPLARALTPEWRGGIYFAAQSKAVKTQAQRDSPDSLALLYLSQWATPQAAQSFAAMYARQIPRQYNDAVLQSNPETMELQPEGTSTLWNTASGPVLITVSGKTVFISESFPLDMAQKLQLVMMGSVPGNPADTPVRLRPWHPKRHFPELTAVLRDVLFRMDAIPRVSVWAAPAATVAQPRQTPPSRRATIY